MSFFHRVLEWAGILSADEDTASVTIRKGDTLSAIAYGMAGGDDDEVKKNVARLMALNPAIEDADHIYAGQIIKIPLEWVH